MPGTPARTGNSEKILLGYGTFFIDDVAVGLTRGGGQFTLERTIRHIGADGDHGSYKDRHVIDESKPKLKMNLLELMGDNLEKIYPAISRTETTDNTHYNSNGEVDPITTNTVKGEWSIDSNDYHTVKWVGKTKDGKSVIIKLFNAINLDNPDWALADKDEVVGSVTFEGTYPEDCEEGYEPWEVTWVA